MKPLVVHSFFECPASTAAISRTDAEVRAAAHEASGDGMASVGGDVAEDDQDDFGVGVLGLHTTKRGLAPQGLARTLSPSEEVAPPAQKCCRTLQCCCREPD